MKIQILKCNIYYFDVLFINEKYNKIVYNQQWQISKKYLHLKRILIGLIKPGP